MNERTRTIALLAHRCCYVATCGYRRAKGGKKEGEMQQNKASTHVTDAPCLFISGKLLLPVKMREQTWWLGQSPANIVVAYRTQL